MTIGNGVSNNNRGARGQLSVPLRIIINMYLSLESVSGIRAHNPYWCSGRYFWIHLTICNGLDGWVRDNVTFRTRNSKETRFTSACVSKWTEKYYTCGMSPCKTEKLFKSSNMLRTVKYNNNNCFPVFGMWMLHSSFSVRTSLVRLCGIRVRVPNSGMNWVLLSHPSFVAGPILHWFGKTRRKNIHKMKNGTRYVHL